MMKSKIVLVADVENGITLVKKVLHEKTDIIEAHSLTTATALLKRNPDLIISGLHFDDSCMLDFLKVAKATPETKEVPFLCIRTVETHLSGAILESVSIACRCLGAVDFFDFIALKINFGDERAEKHFQETLVNLLPPDAKETYPNQFLSYGYYKSI